jgi:hypothetical protein
MATPKGIKGIKRDFRRLIKDAGAYRYRYVGPNELWIRDATWMFNAGSLGAQGVEELHRDLLDTMPLESCEELPDYAIPSISYDPGFAVIDSDVRIEYSKGLVAVFEPLRLADDTTTEWGLAFPDLSLVQLAAKLYRNQHLEYRARLRPETSAMMTLWVGGKAVAAIAGKLEVEKPLERVARCMQDMR